MKSKALLIPLSFLYKTAITVRHRLFDWGLLHSERFDIPIVCIGNITVGGTGKTPMSEMIIDYLSQNMHVALLSRGYGRKTKGYLEVEPQMHYTLTGDEPKMIKMKFPEVPVVVCENRVEGIRRLRREHPEVELIIMDDGFQHRHVDPKINIIMIDYTRPINDDHMLPWGSLRDLPSQLYRANYFIISKCTETIQPIERRLLKKELVRFPYQSLYFTSIESGAPRPLFSDAPERIAYDADVVAMAGIGNPKPFIAGLEERYNVVAQLIYNDHHVYRRRDLQTMDETAGDNACIIMTEKDAVKLINREKIPENLRRKLYYIPISISFIGSSAADFFLKLEKDVRTD